MTEMKTVQGMKDMRGAKDMKGVTGTKNETRNKEKKGEWKRNPQSSDYYWCVEDHFEPFSRNVE